MAGNYVLLDRIELNASAASVTFSSIPQSGYTDLKIVMSARGDAAFVNAGCFMQINAVTSGYTTRDLYGDGSAAASSTNPYGITSKTFVGAINNSGATANTFGNKEIYIPNYAGSNQKSISTDSVIETNGTTAYIDVLAGLCTTTAAITSLTFTLDSGNFVANSTFSLYGIAAVGTTPAVAPKADGGNVIATDGTYWYHAFLSNGTFTPQVGLSADVLVVAGGGGGSGYDFASAGGGAGGLLAFTSQSLTATNYACTVGAGGSGNTANYSPGTNGADSQFAALTLVKGGGGGGASNNGNSNGLVGGSGGGGGAGGTALGGAGTAGQGNAGGNGYSAGQKYPGGGGGGAGAAGSNYANTATGGAGGAGVNTYSSWATATATGVSGFYAGGGGGGVYAQYGGGASGGAGGSGGGGSGGVGAGSTASTSGVANTGGGGGGNGGGTNGSSGGSGIIIIRYPVAS